MLDNAIGLTKEPEEERSDVEIFSFKDEKEAKKDRKIFELGKSGEKI